MIINLAEGWQYLLLMVDWVCDNWTRPDFSIWQVLAKGEDHYIYSKVMCWVALDRAIRIGESRSFPFITSDEAEAIESENESPDKVLSDITVPLLCQAADSLLIEEKSNLQMSRREKWLRVRDTIYLDIMYDPLFSSLILMKLIGVAEGKLDSSTKLGLSSRLQGPA
jgi:hypothetical protein